MTSLFSFSLSARELDEVLTLFGSIANRCSSPPDHTAVLNKRLRVKTFNPCQSVSNHFFFVSFFLSFVSFVDLNFVCLTSDKRDDVVTKSQSKKKNVYHVSTGITNAFYYLYIFNFNFLTKVVILT